MQNSKRKSVASPPAVAKSVHPTTAHPSVHPLITKKSSHTEVSIHSESESEHDPHKGEDPDDLKVDFHEQQINNELKKLDHLSRVFVRRRIHKEQFDILDENGEKLFQLGDFSKGSETTTLNYILTAADGTTQLALFTGDPGFRTGELVVRYPGSQPGYKELKIGSVKQSTPCLKLVPQTTVQLEGHTPQYRIQDESKYGPFWPCKKWSAPAYQIYWADPHKKQAQGRIDERRLTMTTAKRKQSGGAPYPGRRSIPAKGGIMTNQNKRKSSVGNHGHPNPPSSNNNAEVSAQHVRRLSILKAEHGPGLLMMGDSIEDLTEKPTHDHFCVAFDKSVSFKMKLLFIAALLLVNDDVIRRNKTCTRVCFGFTLIIVFLVIVIAIVAGVLAVTL